MRLISWNGEKEALPGYHCHCLMERLEDAVQPPRPRLGRGPRWTGYSVE